MPQKFRQSFVKDDLKDWQTKKDILLEGEKTQYQDLADPETYLKSGITTFTEDLASLDKYGEYGWGKDFEFGDLFKKDKEASKKLAALLSYIG